MADIFWHKYNIEKKDREKFLGQKSAILWFTGLSGSGKSTIASYLEKKLMEKNKLSYTLDGDNLRFGLNSDLGFSDKDREENLRRVGEVAKIISETGLIVICTFVSPFRRDRDRVREKMDSSFVEVYIKTGIDICKDRDPKGLYKKAMNGDIEDFTGLDSPYEEPLNPEITVNTKNNSPEESAGIIMEYLEKKALI